MKETLDIFLAKRVNSDHVTLSSRSVDPFQLIACRSFGEDVQVSGHLSLHSIFSKIIL